MTKQRTIEGRGLIYDATRQAAASRIAFFTSLCGLNSGRLLCDYQVRSRKHSPDSTIQVSRSHDEGATWTSLALDLTTRIQGVPGSLSAPSIVEVERGRLLLFVVDRRGPCTMTLWQSPDDGLTWPEDERLVIHNHDERAKVAHGGAAIDFNQYWEDMGKWSFGHPALSQPDDRQVLCAFYAGTPDCMSIHWARIRI